MANKLFLVFTTLAFCILLANASIYRTVVELDEDDATNQMGPQGPQQKCRREFQQAQHLRACQQWIRRRATQGPRYEELDFEDDMDIFQSQQGSQYQGQQLLRQCCNELQQEDPQCVCPTLKQAARAVRLQGQHGPFQASRIFQTAKHLPNVCNIQQVGVCPFRATPYSPYY